MGNLFPRDGTWVYCGICGLERTAAGDEKLGPCPCGGGAAMTIAYEPGDFTVSHRADLTAADFTKAITSLDAPPAPRLRGAILTPAQLAEGRSAGIVRDATEAERAAFPDCDGWLSGWGFEEPVYVTRKVFPKRQDLVVTGSAPAAPPARPGSAPGARSRRG